MTPWMRFCMLHMFLNSLGTGSRGVCGARAKRSPPHTLVITMPHMYIIQSQTGVSIAFPIGRFQSTLQIIPNRSSLRLKLCILEDPEALPSVGGLLLLAGNLQAFCASQSLLDAYKLRFLLNALRSSRTLLASSPPNSCASRSLVAGHS